MKKSWIGSVCGALALSIIFVSSAGTGGAWLCGKQDGHYVPKWGSKCFPHPSAEQQVRREKGVIVRH